MFCTEIFIAELRSMLAESKVERKNHVRKLMADGTCNNIQDALARFHQYEQQHLVKMSSALIEFIKYVKRDNSSASIINDIAKSILDLKESM